MKLRKAMYLLIFAIMLNFVLPILSFAAPNQMDYRELISIYRRDYGEFDTPIANFDVYVNGVRKGGTNVGKSTSQKENYTQLTPEFTVKVGDVIEIVDRSEVGSGSRINLYDLQVAQGVVGNTASRYRSYSSIQSIEAEVEGDLVIFLNVADNYSKIPKFDNFSQYGNWRSEVIKPSGDPNIQIKGWYFTAIKLTVEDASRPKAEFEIHYQGQNKTDNFSNVIELENYPASINLIDMSTTERGSITSWEWERKVNGSWIFESNSKNPNATINQNVEIFRLRVKNTAGELSSWVEHAIYSKTKGQPDPKPEVPTKPNVDKPDIDIWIEPRDDNPNTPSNEIYEGESIQIEGYVSGGRDPRWSFRAEGSNKSGSGIISRLFVTSEPDEEAYAEQSAKYSDFILDETTNTYKEVSAIADRKVRFTVKEIQPPVIEIGGDLTDSNINIVHIKEPTNIITNVYDLNDPSEEHPNGFDIIEESWSFIKKSTGQVVLQGSGVLNEEDFIFEKGIFETEEYYIFKSTAYNAFKPIRRTEKEINIFVENLPPIVELKITSEDGEPPTFAKEYFDINVNATDKDGYIYKVDVNPLNNYPELKFIKKTDYIPLYNEEYKADYKYISDIANVVTFRVSAMDDAGAETILDIKENIIRPSVYADLKIIDEHDIQKKVYRYIELDFNDSYENAPFGINHTKNILKYRFNNSEWKDISSLQNISDENIRIYYPNYPSKDKAEMYAKNEGKYEFSLKVYDNKDFDSEEVFKIIDIEPDEAPIINYEIESMQHRITEDTVKNQKERSIAITEENIGKGYIKIIDKSKSNDGDKLKYKIISLAYDVNNDGVENDIGYMIMFLEDVEGYDPEKEILVKADDDKMQVIKVKDLNNIIITFITEKDGLGNYYIKEKIQEEITQLPSENSPLYKEILAHELDTISDYSNIFVDNIPPSIMFEIGIDKEINIIIHYDDYIPQSTQDKVNELVNDLESRGLKVRLIKYENKY